MKFIHLSDLHIGKTVNGFQMLDDQRDILLKIIQIIDEEKPESVIIAGDVYDKTTPSGEAVQVFDDFLVRLAKRNLKVFIISGNHDSPERLSFGSRIMDHSGIYLSRTYDGNVEPITLEDEFGKIDVFLLPFVKPANVRQYYPDEPIKTYTDAIRVAVKNMPIDPERRNIIVAHQFVAGAETCESEEITSVGGTDAVEASVFDQFDYVALGHLHGPQDIGRKTIRYCGTPLKYSFSEAKHKKTATILEMFEKGSEIEFNYVPLKPRLDMREIRGDYMTVTSKSFYEGTNLDDYIRIILTDEEDIKDAIRLLRSIYRNAILDYDNSRTRASSELPERIPDKKPLEVVSDFFESQNGRQMSKPQMDLVSELIEEIWGNKE